MYSFTFERSKDNPGSVAWNAKLDTFGITDKMPSEVDTEELYEHFDAIKQILSKYNPWKD